MLNEENQIQEKLNKMIEWENYAAQKLSEIENRLSKMEQQIVAASRNEMAQVITKQGEPPEPAPYRPLVGEKLVAEKTEEEIIPTVDIFGRKERGMKNIESEIGMKWFGRIGILALIFGTAFFLKYAFDNNWIGETGRVILGIAGGLILLGLGEFFRKKYLIYSQILTGGGIALLYLSVYASFGFYHMIGQGVAFVIMGAVTLSAGLLAIHYKGLGLVGLGIMGGFLTPFLLSTGDNNQIGLFCYIAFLNVGILGISFFQNWRSLNLLGFLGTASVFYYWYARFYTNDQLFSTEIFLTIFFLIFAVSTIAHNIVAKKKSINFDVALAALNALAYFGASYKLMDTDFHFIMGFFALAMAFVYIVFAYISHDFNPDDKYLSTCFPGLSAFFLIIAAPIQFDGNWIAVAWAAEAVILAWLGFVLKNYVLRISAWTVFILMTIRLVAFDTNIHDLDGYIVVLNKRFLTFFIAIICSAVIGALYSFYKSRVNPEETKGKTVIILLMNFLILWILSAETLTYFNKQVSEVKQIKAPYCQQGYYMGNPYNVPASYCQRQQDDYRQQSIEYAKKIEKIRNKQNVSLSILWAIYAIILSSVGIFLKYKPLRLFGILLFGLTILKLFFYDLWSLGTLYRIISSISLGAVLLLASFAYNKYKERIREII